MKLHLEKTTLKQMLDFLAHARPLDIQEVEMEGQSFIEQPLDNFNNCYSIVDEEGNVFAIGGVEIIKDLQGAVWMLCTNRVEQHKTTFLRFTKNLLKDYMNYFTYLTNKAWLGNKLHIDWLSWMGVVWGDKTPDGKWHYFYFLRKDNK